VEENVVDHLTDRRHALLRESALELAILSRSNPSRPQTDEHISHVAIQVSNALHVYPAATITLAALLQIRTHKIDMASLIRTPEELFLSEEEWAGKAFREKRQSRRAVNKDDALHPPETELEEPERTWMDVDARVKCAAGGVVEGEYEQEGPGELTEVLEYVVGIINNLDRRIREGRYPSTSAETSGGSEAFVGLSSDSDRIAKMKVKAEINSGDMETVGDPGEDPILRNLRLNLLALAKRAPLDTIARLPKDLVPEHIRHFVPTLGVS
jgi:bromodomain-containing protein 7/9